MGLSYDANNGVLHGVILNAHQRRQNQPRHFRLLPPNSSDGVAGLARTTFLPFGLFEFFLNALAYRCRTASSLSFRALTPPF